MSADQPPNQRSVSELIYQKLLRVCAARLRREAAGELEQMFRDAHDDARASKGSWGLAGLWIRTLVDLLVTAIEERVGESDNQPKNTHPIAPSMPQENETMGTLLQDLRYAFRTLTKSPGFVAVAIISLALGIGANTTIFTIINAVFLNPLPVEEPSRLVNLYTSDEGIAGEFIANPVSYPNYRDFRDQNDAFSGLAAFVPFQFTLKVGDDPQQVTGQLTTGNYFEVLGVKVYRGRTFNLTSAQDQELGAHPEVVISHSLWAKMFGADPEVIG